MMNLLCAPLEQLLVSGGDRRLEIDPCTKLNSSGCSPSPYPESGEVYSFGSCTASTISESAFCAVERERVRLLQILSVAEASAQSPGDRGWSGLARAFDAETKKLRSELLQLLGLDGMAVDLVFSPSGTDSVLQALALARILSGGCPIDCLLVGSDETGSGVGHALAGRHFNSMTSTGLSVVQGDPVSGLAENVRLISFPVSRFGFDICSEDVSLSESSQYLCVREQELIAAVGRSVYAGCHVLLQAMEISKLGRSFPSGTCLRAIRARFADAVTIVVDGCQMRSGRERLRWHLAEGHMVLISGSKFFTGPPFSGALLVPSSLDSRINAVSTETVIRLLGGLRDYMASSDWPGNWRTLRAALPARINIGQYLRWIAALEEMRAYFSIPEGFRCAALHGFASMVREVVGNRDAFRLLTGSTDKITDDALNQIGLKPVSIFPFLLRQDRHRHTKDAEKDCRQEDRRNIWASCDEARAIYHALNRDVSGLLLASCSATERAVAARRCHIGQPVALSLHSGERVGALRICASARTVSRLWASHSNGLVPLSLAREREEIETILDKIELLLPIFS